MDTRSGLREHQHFESHAPDTQNGWLEILRHVNNAAFAHDLQGTITFFNDAAERLFGVPIADALGKNIFDLITPESAEAAHSMLSSRLIGTAPDSESFILRTGAGEQECFVLTTVIRENNEDPPGFFSIVSPFFISSMRLHSPYRHSNSVMLNSFLGEHR